MTASPKTAPEFLDAANAVLNTRGKEYDSPQGERSGPAVADIFNRITRRDLTTAEVYLMLNIVKLVRQWSAPGYHPDSALDAVAFSALTSEALAQAAEGSVGTPAAGGQNPVTDRFEGAPRWAKYSAIDVNGSEHWYQFKPKANHRGFWTPAGGKYCLSRRNDRCPGWIESLLERPAKKTPPSVDMEDSFDGATK